MMSVTGQFLKAGLTAISGHFPICISSPLPRSPTSTVPRVSGRVMLRKKAMAMGTAKMRDHLCRELVWSFVFCLGESATSDFHVDA